MLANLTRTSAAVMTAICALTFVPNMTLSVSAAEESLEAETETVYDSAQTDLPENLYVLYRIIERIARANDLDNAPWRVKIADADEINAYATEANLIVVSFGLLDQMAGDSSALACVVGHEMAHNVKQHAAIWTSKMAEWQEGLEDENEEAYSELEEQSADLRRTQELEADAWGYRYAATAGFEAAGCLRGFSILARLPDSLRDSSTHPAVPKRIEALEALMTEEPPESLANKGQRLLKTTKPLTYEMLEEDRWLRINSERGGSFVTDLERLFPEEE